MASPLQRKVGPLPVWGWLAAVGVGAILYLRARSANQSSQSGGVGDPNAVDPTTGLTYGQEAQLALGYGGSQLTPTTGQSTDGSGGAGPSWNDIIGGWQDIAGAWKDIATSGIQGPPGPAGKDGAGSGGTKPGKPKQPKLRGKGAILAPFGPKKPTAPKGYHDVGLGHGFWEFLPNAKPKSTGAKPHADKRAPAHQNEKTAHNDQSHKPPPPAKKRVTVGWK